MQHATRIIPPATFNLQPATLRRRLGFTLVELLVVIAIIAILAGLLVPALRGAKVRAQKTAAQMDLQGIVTAVHKYESDNNRFPLYKTLMASANAGNAAGDFTFGTINVAPGQGRHTAHFDTPTGVQDIRALDASGAQLTEQRNNSDLMAILLDLPAFPNGVITSNANHVLNTTQTRYLNAKMVSDPNSAGVGPDGVYRDVWKHPYIITIDANSDGKVLDPLYRFQAVSQSAPNSASGFNGLSNPTDLQGNGNHFQINAPVAAWSAGPDEMIDPKSAANAGANKDNILSWGQ
jgi:prepilin-type N-terminal cleavage/methylation domain-containing protein